MALPAQSTVAWQVCISLLQALAIGSTLIRLWHRWKIQRMWWDDWIVIVPLIADILYFTTMWLQFKSKLSGHLFVSFWFNNILFLLIMWVSRISLSLSVMRIFPPQHTCRRFGFGLAITFLVLCITTILMSVLGCYDKSIPQWYNVPLPLCIARRKSVLGGIYLAIAFHYVADILLVLSPLIMLWKIKLPGHQRRMILVLFSCSVLSLLAFAFFSSSGLVPIARLGPSAFLLLGMGAQLQAGVTLCVCNVVVVATMFYVISKREREVEDESLNSKCNGGETGQDADVDAGADARGRRPPRVASVFRSFFGNRNGNANGDAVKNTKNQPGTNTKAKLNNNNNNPAAADRDSSAHSNADSLLELTSLYEDSTVPSGDVSPSASQLNSHLTHSHLHPNSNFNSNSRSPANLNACRQPTESSSKMIEIEIDSVEMEMALMDSRQESTGPVWSFPSSSGDGGGGDGEGAGPVTMLSFSDSGASASSISASASRMVSQIQTESSQMQSFQSEVLTTSSQLASQSQSSDFQSQSSQSQSQSQSSEFQSQMHSSYS